VARVDGIGVTSDWESQPSDSQLLWRHAKGDHEAFGVLFSRHRERLWAVALRTLGDPDEAADALQDAMISAFRRAGSFRGDSAVTTWLHRIVVNACLDRIRRRASRPTVPAGDERSLDGLGRAGAATDPAGDRATALDVEAALRMLPYEQRAALVLVDMLGYPVQAAADMLSVSVGTIKSRCARGRARLAPHVSHLAPQLRSGNRQGPGDVSTAQVDRDSRAEHAADEQRGGALGQPVEGGGDRI